MSRYLKGDERGFNNDISIVSKTKYSPKRVGRKMSPVFARKSVILSFSRLRSGKNRSREHAHVRQKRPEHAANRDNLVAAQYAARPIASLLSRIR